MDYFAFSVIVVTGIYKDNNEHYTEPWSLERTMLEETANYSVYLVSTLVVIFTIIGSIYALYNALEKRVKESEKRLGTDLNKRIDDLRDDHDSLSAKVDNLTADLKHLTADVNKLSGRVETILFLMRPGQTELP
jgi:peptidoglycan hydrolase CwlO-like protein